MGAILGPTTAVWTGIGTVPTAGVHGAGTGVSANVPHHSRTGIKRGYPANGKQPRQGSATMGGVVALTRYRCSSYENGTVSGSVAMAMSAIIASASSGTRPPSIKPSGFHPVESRMEA